jgi:hypothetical protein
MTDTASIDLAFTQFVRGLPKAELHMHIEGSLEPELMFELAQRNGITLPFASVEQIRAAYDFSEPAGLPGHLLPGRGRAADRRGLQGPGPGLFQAPGGRRRHAMPRSSSIPRPTPIGALPSAS